MFDCEYWSLEQAKLGAAKELPLAGQIVAITGAGGAIGAATAQGVRRGRRRGRAARSRRARRRKQAKAIGGIGARASPATSPMPIGRRRVRRRSSQHFGGVDIVVSNAGAAWQGRIGEVDEAMLRKSFELNFFGHQRVAQAAVKIMLAQGTGGCLLFNVSKQAVNPGPNFGPYGLPKAATLLARAPVRGRLRRRRHPRQRASTPTASARACSPTTSSSERSKARGVSEKDYMSGNLLGREVTAEDVAQAFLHQALELKTTGDVTTVDGGNIAAALR